MSLLDNFVENLLQPPEKREVKAVHKSELDEFLQSVEISEDIDQGKIRCVSCDEIVSRKNIGAVFGDSGEIKVLCNKVKCMESDDDVQRRLSEYAED